MNQTKIFTFFVTLLLLPLVYAGCKAQKQDKEKTKGMSDMTLQETNSHADTKNRPYFINMNGDTINKIVKSDEEWKKELTDFEFYVLRKKGTERAFTGDLLKIKKEGLYCCKACGYPLFRSQEKFDSGTGWPSFYQAADKNAIAEDVDYDIGYKRTEVMCGKCGGHLGHVFDDGPAPTGLRYCINSVSLSFIEAKN